MAAVTNECALRSAWTSVGGFVSRFGIPNGLGEVMFRCNLQSEEALVVNSDFQIQVIYSRDSSRVVESSKLKSVSLFVFDFLIHTLKLSPRPRETCISLV